MFGSYAFALFWVWMFRFWLSFGCDVFTGTGLYFVMFNGVGVVWYVVYVCLSGLLCCVFVWLLLFAFACGVCCCLWLWLLIWLIGFGYFGGFI